MARDRLDLLLSVRRRAVDEAMQKLAACIATEQEAASRLAYLDTSLARERAAASATVEPFPDMQAFARWSAMTRLRRRTAAATLAQAEAQTLPARHALADARAAYRAVEELISLRHADMRSREAARQARDLDDVAGRLHRERQARSSLP